jgi:hypothetical protein
MVGYGQQAQPEWMRTYNSYAADFERLIGSVGLKEIITFNTKIKED